MSTAMQKAEQAALAPFFSPEQEKMILSAFLGNASKEEAAVLMEVARVRRLNPLLKQIHFVKRWDNQKREEVWSYQTSIDGLRAIAERTGRYEGQTEPQWCGTDGVWRSVWLDKAPPAAARVGVYKAGFREALYGIARWDTYVQTKRDGTVTQFWSRMPDLMLSKCAEALALRKAFPEDMSGLYTAEEMGSEPAVDAAPAPREEPKPAAPRATLPAKREPVVIPEVVDPTPEEKQAARNIVAAAETLQAEIGPSPSELAARRLALYNRATSPRGANMPKGSIGRWVEKVLGRHVASTKDWTSADMDKLEADLERMDSLPDDQPSMQ